MARCPLCGADSEPSFFAERGHDVIGCDRCDLFFIDPYPRDADAVHESVTTFAYEDLDILDAERQYVGEREHFGRHFAQIRAACGNARSVLDVGCGTGGLLELFGSDPTVHRVGIELNAKRAAFARRRAGCAIEQVPVERFSSPRRFDAIILYNVLSHIPDLDRLFTALRGLLSPTGVIVLKVGEMERRFDPRAVFDWGIPDHLHFLGMRTLEFIADRYGFEIRSRDRVPYSVELFTRERWLTPGRSRARNLVKAVVARVPFALPLLARLYDARYGGGIYTSLVVLGPRATSPADRT